jgi:hypothetical protein
MYGSGDAKCKTDSKEIFRGSDAGQISGIFDLFWPLINGLYTSALNFRCNFQRRDGWTYP